MSKSDALIESLRESVIEHTNALDKLKALTMLPNGLHISIEMAANYYEAHVDAIESTIRKNRDELNSDGMQGSELSAFKAESGISTNAGALTIIPRRAILRMDDVDKTFTPTDLGKLFDKPMSAIKVNIGKAYAKLMPVAIHGGGITVERYAIRWRQSVLNVIGALK